MNERTLLNQSYLANVSRTVPDTGQNLDSAEIDPSEANNLKKLLLPFIAFTHSLLQSKQLMKTAFSLLGLLFLITGSARAQAPATIDLSVSKKISKQNPALGDVISYTVIVRNGAGSATATNVVVKDQLPLGGVSYVAGSATTVRGTGNYTSATGLWNLSAVAPGDSAVLTLQATVLERGVWFNTAEVMSADQTDADSQPNNQSLGEDDYSTVCFSVPIYWYVGDEFTVTVPSGYKNITWYRNNVNVTTVSADLAVINADSSLTIKSPGTYRFTTSINGCPALNCCDIEVIQGLFGSLGNYVWNDTNKDGLQNDGATGIDGVKVYLYNATGTTKLDSTITAGGGRYLFDSLTDGQYKVKFAVQPNFTFSQQDVASTPTDSLDSDAGSDGFTRVYTIDTNKPVTDIARNNPNVDAGLILSTASLGDYVFADNNKNGIQDGGDTPIPGVKVVLYVNGVASLTTTTDVTGFYSFTGLASGSSTTYTVGFTTPSGYTATLANQGGDDTKDSDADIVTGMTQSVTLAAGEFNTSLDAGFIPSTASLGDYVFADNNKNGIQDGGDTPIPGVVVVLLDANNNPLKSTTTDASGIYSFTGLTPGIPYSVSFVTPAGYASTSASQGGDDTKDSDANSITGQTQSVILAAGEYNPTLDAGFTPSCPTNFSLIASNDANLCNGDSIKLTASSLPGAKICWFLTPTDGTAFAIVDNGQLVTVKPTITTTYYVEATVNGCYSARKPVIITVNTIQAPIILSTIKNKCPEQTVNLATVPVDNNNPALTYEWYTSTIRSQATRVTNLTAVAAGKYYLFSRSAEGCYSSPTVLTVEVVNCNCPNLAEVQVGPGLATCSVDPVPLKATISGSATSVTWTSNGTGTFSAPNSLTSTYTPSTTDITAGSVLITATTNDPDGAGDCSASTSALILKVNKRPEAPTGVACDDTLICQGGATKLIGFAPGSKINWYDQDGKLIGSTLSGGKQTVQPAKSGVNIYYAEAISAENCTSATRSSVTVTVGSCQADLAVVKRVVTAGPYSVGQKITYSITATNNGPITGTAVKVTDLLPSTLMFVSATPAEEYSAATGVWTIGTLTTGSNRNLLIEATIIGTGTGSIKNTAIIGGSNNDPGHPGNDTSSVTIPMNPCSVEPPYIACAVSEICKGDVATLKATGCTSGTVIWSDGQRGLSVSVKPEVTATYTASCISGTSCTSGVSNLVTITVRDPQPPTIVASATTVCPGTSVTLTASGCAGGIVEWSEGPQTGASIVVNPMTKTTYTATCIIGTCLSKPAAKTIDIATDVPTPSIVSSATAVCPGSNVTLTINNCLGTPQWSSTTATTSSIVVTPTVGNKIFTVYCNTGSCASKTSQPTVIQLVAPTIPAISADVDSVCANAKVVLTAYGCTGTVVWSDKQVGSSISVYPSASTSYFAQCKTGENCISDPSASLPVTVVSPSVPIVKASSLSVCSGQVISLTATGCNGTVQWVGLDKVGPIIQVVPGESRDYYATCKVGNCTSDPSNKVRVTVSTSGLAAPIVTASSLSVCSSAVVSLTATGCTGDIIWSDNQRGAVITVTATPTNKSFYAICRPANSTLCASGQSNVININVTPTSKPTIVRCVCSADTICPGETVKLNVKNCVGTPHWSTQETTASIVVAPSVTTSYTVYCQQGACPSEASDAYTITVMPVGAPTIVASATAVEPGGTISLTATGCIGEVIWSAMDATGNNRGAVLVVQPDGAQTYYAQCKFHDCLSTPSNAIIINKGDCVAKAGTLVPVSPTVCVGTSTSVIVAATPNGGLVQPAGYSVLYLLTQGAGLVVEQTSATPSFSLSAVGAEYTINTLVYNATVGDKNYLNLSAVKPGITTSADVLKLITDQHVCADLDLIGAKVSVRVVAPPTLSAGSSPTVCAGSSVTLTAQGCTNGVVTWSDQSIGASIVKVLNSDLSITAICTVDGCSSGVSQPLVLKLGTPAIPAIAVDKPVICTSETVSLTAIGCAGGTYVWSDPASTTGSVLTVTPTQTVQYRVKCVVGQCASEWSAFNTITVGTPAAPTVSVAGGSTSTTACFGSPVTLVAQGCPDNSYVTWSNDQVGQSITVSLTTSATYTASCNSSAQCKSAASNAVVVTVLPKVASPVVVDKLNSCPFNTVDLSTAVSSTVSTSGGVFEYYTDATLSAASKVANPSVVGTGTYYIVERTVSGCVSLPVAVHVQITGCEAQLPCDERNPATANAGKDAGICAAKTYQLAGVLGGSGKTAHWTTSGNGTFDNAFLLNAVYRASAEDILAGKVTLTLSVSTNNASCPVATDDMILTIEGSKTIPTISILGSTSLCYGDSVRLKAPDGAAGYLWNNKATTQTIVVQASGVYNVQVLDPKGCSSVKSNNVTVNVADPVLPPLVSNLRNSCPAKIVDLTKALSSTIAGYSYGYRICECNTANIVIRPDSVCEGTYWVVAKGPTGCLSAPAKIEVKVFNCAADTLTADVVMAKTADKSVVKRGELVTYTLTVSNQGKYTAHNVDVRDVLPKGLELVSVLTPKSSVSYGVLTKRIDSLPVGKSESIVFTARLLTKGEVVNTAQITYLDNVDTDLTNNSSSVTVKDTSAAKTGIVGLAKAVVGTPTAVGDSLINIRYGFVVTNFGDDTLKGVQVKDDLAHAFAPNQIEAATVSTTSADFSLAYNPAFTGTGANTNLFDSTSSYIAPGRSQTFFLDVTVKRASGDSTKTFSNIAAISALSNGTKVEDVSVDGGDVDPDNDGDPTNNAGFSTFTLGAPQTSGPSIGVALAVVKIELQPDSSYNVTYKATVKNFGDVALYGISLTDSLAKAFPAPTSFSVVGSPVVGAGSHLVANAAFNGNTEPNLLTDASYLNVSEQDTVLITVNVKTNGNKGPFYSTITGEGHTADTTQTVTDISNNGLDPKPAGATATGVRFDLPTALLGVAKSVGKPALLQTGIYDVTYTIKLSNLGMVPLTNVQVVDNLSQTFGHGALIVDDRIQVTADSGLTADSLYTGQGLITNMLVDSLSTLPVGATRNLVFTVRVNAKNADSLTFYNTAYATALSPDNVVIADTSTAGINEDPDNDLDPRNNNEPTPVSLNGLSGASYIGVAMAVADTTRQPDGSYNVTYQIVVQNFGTTILRSVSVSDSLSKVFNSQTGSRYSVVKAPITTSTGSTLKLNPNFDGNAESLIVIGDSTSTLLPGQIDTILVVINVATNGSTTTFLNSAFAQANSPTGVVTDVSTNGLIADLNGNGNPTDDNEREATPLNLPPTDQSVFIPEGFSPNGDGINDLFVIRGLAGVTVSLEVYNRWGNMVYKNEDYHNDWNGKPNTGVTVGSDADGLPDGTYYYVIRTSDGRRFVRYMMINR
ncbi:SdrD B-like domain-containing protein [Spirosoma endbachense]|nr:SdrD B-like domain-containing protein [Spirosoma endbachense]